MPATAVPHVVTMDEYSTTESTSDRRQGQGIPVNAVGYRYSYTVVTLMYHTLEPFANGLRGESRYPPYALHPLLACTNDTPRWQSTSLLHNSFTSETSQDGLVPPVRRHSRRPSFSRGKRASRSRFYTFVLPSKNSLPDN